MSKETYSWLNTNTLIGMTDKRGDAWHRRADMQTVDPITGWVGNHYPGPIPLDHVERRLFDWTAEGAPLGMLVPNPDYDQQKAEQDSLVLYDPDFEAALNTLPAHMAELIRHKLTIAAQYDNLPEIYRPVYNHQAIYRSNNFDVMGIHTDGYQAHDYQEWLLKTVAQMLDAELQIGSAGLLRNGAQAWVSVEMTENFVTPQGVEFRPNLVATTSLDGSLATTYFRSVTNVVCDNTLYIARREGRDQSFRVKHTKNSQAKIADARAALKIIHQDADEFAAEVKVLTETTVTDKQWSDFLDVHIPLDPDGKGRGHTLAERKRETYTGLWNADPRVKDYKNTAFGVLQTANTWWTHFSITKGAAKGQPRFASIQESTLRGKGAEYDQQALADLERVLAAS